MAGSVWNEEMRDWFQIRRRLPGRGGAARASRSTTRRGAEEHA